MLLDHIQITQIMLFLLSAFLLPKADCKRTLDHYHIEQLIKRHRYGAKSVSVSLEVSCLTSAPIII